MRKARVIAPLLALSALAGAGPTASAEPPVFWSWSQRPVMGWNSWDCFGAGVNEAQTLANARYMKERLLAHGFDLVTIDIQWYEPLAHADRYRPGAALEMDDHGRLLPAANRFPSSKQARSFAPLAQTLHAMGLRFGLHLLRGIPRAAVQRNVIILGTQRLRPGGIRAADIADESDVCRWNTDMYGVDMSKPGAQEYYDSVFALLASWGVDFVKVDDLSAPVYHAAEIEAIRKAIDKTGRPMVFSTSPGATPLSDGAHIEMHANQWRISDDFWDHWPALQEQFARLDAWTPFRGPGHFPDADMLPVGRIRTWDAAHSNTRFTHEELYTLMNLWCIARSPLILGADLPSNDDFTLQLMTNDEVLAVDQHSSNNRQLRHEGSAYIWVADAEGSPDKYVALFNAPSGANGGAASLPIEIDVPARDLGYGRLTAVRDLWKHQDVALKDDTQLSAELRPHCSVMFRVGGR